MPLCNIFMSNGYIGLRRKDPVVDFIACAWYGLNSMKMDFWKSNSNRIMYAISVV